jgi:AraC-like DNA-binding protein
MFALIFALGAGQGVFLAAVLASSTRNRVPNRLLAAVMGLVAFDLAMASYHLAGLETSFPHLIGIDFPIAFLYGPLLYLYARTLSDPEHTLRRRDLVHSVPFLTATAYCAPFYALSAPAKLHFLANQTTHLVGLRLDIVSHLKLVAAVVYVIATLWVLHRHRRSVRDGYSSIDRIDLTWLRNVSIGAIALAIVSLVVYALRVPTTDRVIGLEPGGAYDLLTLLAVTVFIYGVGFFGLRQQEIVSPGQTDIEPTWEDESELIRAPRYARSGLDEDAAESGRETLLAFMKSARPYRSGDLTLGELAAMLDMSPHNLTEILSTKIGQSFYDFVNSFRVREVQARLANPDEAHLTILAIALEAGFNSKSTFNTVFRKHVGITPSQFRKNASRRDLESTAAP